MGSSGFLVFSGRSNKPLAEEIVKYLGLELSGVEIFDFSDGEICVQVTENVRERDVFIVQPLSYPGNRNIMELLIMIDALKRSSAASITTVIPYYGYSRQDRKTSPRVPISAKLLADLITVAGAKRVLTLDLHVGQIQGFFDIPVDNLYAKPVMIEHIRKMNIKDLVIVSPDAGGVERARAFARQLDADLVIIDKRREKANIAQVMNIIGDVKGKRAMIVDDMIDTAGTMCEGVKALLNNGAREVYACCSHAVLSGPAIERITQSEIKEVIVTDSILLSEEKRECKKLTILPIAPLLGEAIKRIHAGTSVSSLFM